MTERSGFKRYTEGQPSTTRYERYYDKTAGPGDDFTFGEVVWNDARKDLLKEQRKAKKRKAKK